MTVCQYGTEAKPAFAGSSIWVTRSVISELLGTALVWLPTFVLPSVPYLLSIDELCSTLPPDPGPLPTLSFNPDNYAQDVADMATWVIKWVNAQEWAILCQCIGSGG